jgi:hypothetical protein
MQTEWQRRTKQVEDIILLTGISKENDRVLWNQLETMSAMAVDVLHTLMTKAIMLVDVPQQDILLKEK